MKYYLKAIKYFQNILIFLTVLIILIILPPLFAFSSNSLPEWLKPLLFDISHWSVLFVMVIRPLADLLPRKNPLRPLVILRKSFGILSASVVVMFLMVNIITGDNYLLNYLNYDFWFSEDYKFLARIGDITALILLITSNNFSKKVLGKWWKRIQKLAYVYFYSGMFYIWLSFGNETALFGIVVVTILVILAWAKKRFFKKD